MEKNTIKDKQKQYEKYVKGFTPEHNLWLNMVKAFFTGGLICILGQFILNYATDLGLDKDTAGSWCSLILIFLSVLLTGLNIYPKIGKFGGARRSGSHHRICQLCRRFRHRIQSRRSGIRHWLQDLYHRRSRHLYESEFLGLGVIYYILKIMGVVS